MSKHEAETNYKKSYTPNERLITHLKERLDIERKYNKTKYAGGELSEKDKRNRRRLISKKVSILDKYVFESMANLVTFFEHCNKYPELREIFEDDIKELLLGENETEKTTNVFNRLIASILFLTRNADLNDFRFLLLGGLQWRIYQIMVASAENWFKETTIVKNVIYPDLARAVAWTEYLSISAQKYRIDTKSDFERRPVLF